MISFIRTIMECQKTNNFKIINIVLDRLYRFVLVAAMVLHQIVNEEVTEVRYYTM